MIHDLRTVKVVALIQADGLVALRGWGIPDIHLACILLCKAHEDYRALCSNSIDHQCRYNHRENRAEGKTEMAFMS